MNAEAKKRSMTQAMKNLIKAIGDVDQATGATHIRDEIKWLRDVAKSLASKVKRKKDAEGVDV